MNWIDIAAALFLAFSAWNGYRRGLINELTGFLALIVAGYAALTYTGEFDGFMAGTAHLGPGSSHIAGLLGFASIAYLMVWTAGFVLDRIAKLPVLDVINGILGSLLAITKTVFILVFLHYLATLAPMPADLRADLDRSTLGRSVGTVDTSIDGNLGAHLPPYLQPFWSAIAQHRGDTVPEPAPLEASPAPSQSP